MILGRFKVQGHSMSPKINEGREVLVSSIPYLFSEPKIGDVVAFWHFDKVFIKRIKKVQRGNFLMEGDNISDSLKIGWISKKDIIGKVIKTF